MNKELYEIIESVLNVGSHFVGNTCTFHNVNTGKEIVLTRDEYIKKIIEKIKKTIDK